MGRVTLRLPRLGETMEEGRVVAWLVAPNAAFRRGDMLLEVETDKTVVEVLALADGTLAAQLVAPGDTVALGDPIAEVDMEGDDAGSAQAGPATARAEPASRMAVGLMALEGPRPAASPAARAVARSGGINLAAVQGTGRRGCITGADVAAVQGTIQPGGADRPTIVLLHGLFDDYRGWRDLPRRLREAGHAVIAPDLPGHGVNDAVAGSMDAAMDMIAAMLPDGRVRLVGHSMGGAIATRLAAQLGDRVERLILLSPAGTGARMNADFVDGLLAESTAALAASIARGGFQQVDVTGDLARLACSVTVVFGLSDRILDWRDVANLPAHAAIHLVCGAGHIPHAADAGLVRGLILDATPEIGLGLHP